MQHNNSAPTLQQLLQFRLLLADALGMQQNIEQTQARLGKPPVYRKMLPRIFELRDLLPDSIPSNAYFQDLENSLAESSQKLKRYRDIEYDLARLDDKSWAFLKSELSPLLQVRHERRGWQPLFDKLNQAKAYRYLMDAGYARVRFVPTSKVSSQKTPDLEALKDHERVLCEVKTINISEPEAIRRTSNGVRTVTDKLDARFFGRLNVGLDQARSQMFAFDPNATLKLAYFVINFDDSLHEYADRYSEQIARFMADNPTPEMNVVFDWMPPFGSAAT